MRGLDQCTAQLDGPLFLAVRDLGLLGRLERFDWFLLVEALLA